MKVIKKYPKCTICTTQGRFLIYDIDEEVYINNIPFKKTSVYNIQIFKENLYFNDKGKLYVIESNHSLKEIYRIDGADSVNIVADNVIESFKRINRKELEYNFYDLKHNKLWYNLGYEFVDIINSNYVKIRNVLNMNEERFTVRNIHNGNPLWSYNLPEGYKIFGAVHIMDDILFFISTKSMLKDPKSIGIEIATGKQLWEIDRTVDFQADTYSKLLRGYGGDHYQVLDPKKGELIINKDMSEYYEKGIFPVGFNNTISKDKLWFVSGQGENVRFGAINTQTSEIDFIQDFPLEEDWQLAKPVFHQGRLYLKDSNNVLHILE